jgi:pimeloyl-ACP methyl ester carboxylesterase
MLVELVEAVTPDGLRLHGALHRAATASTVGLDVILCLHGTGSNFYDSSLWAGLIPRMLSWGASALAVNTRGHDGISTLHGSPAGRHVLGSAYELVDDCRHDVAGWLGLLRQRGFGRIGLLGHSLGAVKAVYSLAHAPAAQQPESSVECLLAISPPRLSHSYFKSTPRGPGFVQEYNRAEEHVRAGQPDLLMEVRFPLPYVVTAAGYIDKYGPAERYNILPLVAGVPCPQLYTYGTVELQYGMAFREMPEALAAAAVPGRQLDVAVVAGADHVYTAAHADLAARIERWLRKRNQTRSPGQPSS